VDDQAGGAAPASPADVRAWPSSWRLPAACCLRSCSRPFMPGRATAHRCHGVSRRAAQP